MLILGIDPGTARMGWGLLTVSEKDPLKDGLKLLTYGCFETAVGVEMGKRLLHLRKELVKVIEEHKPNHLAIEQLFFGANSRTAMTVGQARGVVMVTAEEYNIPLFEYQGLSVKKTLTGFGHTDKKQIQEYVKKRLKLKELPKPDDAADAIAIAICHSIRIYGQKA
jgi:crossover junction endodeoxyribonuclease RuvC